MTTAFEHLFSGVWAYGKDWTEGRPTISTHRGHLITSLSSIFQLFQQHSDRALYIIRSSGQDLVCQGSKTEHMDGILGYHFRQDLFYDDMTYFLLFAMVQYGGCFVFIMNEIIFN